MKEYFIVVKTDGTMLVEEYERKANGLSDFFNKYVGSLYTSFNSRLEVQEADKSNSDVMVIFGYDELKLKDSGLNIIGSLLYADYVLGNIILGRLGFYKGEPDVVGFETAEQANELLITLQTFYNKVTKDIEKDIGLEVKEFLKYLENKGYFVRYN